MYSMLVCIQMSMCVCVYMYVQMETKSPLQVSASVTLILFFSNVFNVCKYFAYRCMDLVHARSPRRSQEGILPSRSRFIDGLSHHEVSSAKPSTLNLSGISPTLPSDFLKQVISLNLGRQEFTGLCLLRAGGTDTCHLPTFYTCPAKLRSSC